MSHISPSIAAATEHRHRAALRDAASTAAAIEAARSALDDGDVPAHCAGLIASTIDLSQYGEALDIDPDAQAWAESLPDLDDSREALDAVRTLRTADAAALPLLHPIHEREAHTASTTATHTAQHIAALTRARVHAAHICSIARIARSQRAAAATSGSAWAQASD